MKQWYALYASLYSYGLTLIPAWIGNYVHYKMLDDITSTFPNFIAGLDMWLLIHAGIKVKSYEYKGSQRPICQTEIYLNYGMD